MGSKTVYTERDIEDLASRGVDTLTISGDVYLTDLAREKAERLKISLVREDETPSSAPMRPYISQGAPPRSSQKEGSVSQQLHERVRSRVIEQLGEGLDHHLLDTIIRRVLSDLGES